MTVNILSPIASTTPTTAVFEDDVEILESCPTATWVGFDLTGLGTQAGSGIHHAEVPNAHVDYNALAGAMKAAYSGGLDGILFSQTFRKETDRASRRGILDAAAAVHHIRDFVSGEVSVAVSPEADLLVAAAEQIKDAGTNPTVETPLPQECTAELIAAADAARALGVSISVMVPLDQIEDIDATQVVAFADRVRVRTLDPHAAREFRFAIRTAAREAGKNVPVLTDIGVIVSSTQAAATERAYLIEAITGKAVFDGFAHAVGTVHDAADEIERWVGFGATDGVVIVPASLPTDLASTVRGVLPLLAARAE